MNITRRRSGTTRLPQHQHNRNVARRPRRALRVLCAVGAVGLALAGCSSGRHSSSGTHATSASSGGSGCTYYLVSFQGAVNTFMAVEEKGVEQAGKNLGIHAVFEGPSTYSVPQQISLLKAAAAAKPCGIATGLADPVALNAPITSIINQGTPVVLWNVQDFNPTSGPIAQLAYVGQDETKSGDVLAQHLAPMLKRGDNVVYAMDTPGEIPGVQRFAGVKQTLAQYGINTIQLNVGTDPTSGESILQAYLAAHPNVQSIVSNGAIPAQAADEYVQRSNQIGKYVLASFDMAPPIVSAIKDGIQAFALDQQPYLEGYLAIQDLFMEHQYGFKPANINTGTLFVDKTDITQFQKLVNAGIGA